MTIQEAMIIFGLMIASWFIGYLSAKLFTK